jgi:hypothetical protein
LAYAPGDRVEAFYQGQWRPGRICPGNPPQAGYRICVVLDGGDAENFDEVNVRPAGAGRN